LTALERIPIEWIGMRSASLAFAHVLFGKPVSIFPGHALVWPVANVRFVQQQRENHLSGKEDRNPGGDVQDGQCQRAAAGKL
jgi:hypothetical protein